MNRLFDRQQIRRAFGRVAGSYEATAVLQQQVADRLLEQLEYFQSAAPERIVDVGAGTGRATVQLQRRYRRAQVVALDLAVPMLQRARGRGSWLRPLRAVCADAQALPLAEASVDLLFSSLCLQWIEDVDAAFAEFRRVLRPGGMLLVSTFGPGTLRELREAFAATDREAHVSRFPSMQALGDALLRHGFRDPVLDQDTFTLTYPDVPTLMHELRAIGASNAMRGRRRTLTGKQRMRNVFAAYEPLRRDGVLPSSWEVVYAHAWGPPPGQPRRDSGGIVASFPADRIPVRRRDG